MKKYDEGYALPFVLVVFLVLSLIATSVLTFSLKNLQSQQASIQRAKDQYAAQGEIEKAYVQLSCLLENEVTDFQRSKVEESINTVCVVAGTGSYTVSCVEVAYNDADGSLEVHLLTNLNPVNVACVIKITGTITENDLSGDGVADTYKVNNAKLSYESYTVTTNGGAES